MARGWESKSVESQMEERGQTPERRKPMSAEERVRIGRKEGLEMSRLRVRRELQETSSALRRASLEQALRFLDAELRKLE